VALRRLSPNDVFVPESMATGHLFRPRIRSDGSADSRDLASVLVGYLDSPATQIAILGESGVGKSSLLKHAAGKRGLVMPFFRCTSTTRLSDLLAYIDEVRITAKTSGASGTAGAFGAGVTLDHSKTIELLERDFASQLSAKMLKRGVQAFALDNFHKITDVSTQTAVLEAMENFFEQANEGRRQKLIVLGIGDRLAPVLGSTDEGTMRRITQYTVPRMGDAEIQSIYDYGFNKLGLTVEQPILRRMIFVADGFPYFAHLLGLATARAAVESSQPLIDEKSFFLALKHIKDRYQLTEVDRYRNAAESKGADTPNDRPRKHALLMLAHDEDRREWRIGDIAQLWARAYPESDRTQTQIRKILRELCSKDRGALLKTRRDRGEVVYFFSGPVTRVCLRIMSYRDDNGIWSLQTHF
jgi:hypothetical protein